MIPVAVIEVKKNEVYHLRLDKPFESYLARLFISIAKDIKTPQQAYRVLIDFTVMNEEEYEKIPRTTKFNSIPQFIQSEIEKGNIDGEDEQENDDETETDG